MPSSDLEPATSDQFRNELTACLSLVVPVGMDAEARRDWLAVAWGTLKHLPADMLTYGCQKARETADHPSKIVPAIVEATREWLELRRKSARYAVPAPPERQIGKQEEPPCTPEEAAAIMDELGLSRESREMIRPTGPRRKPTRQDYIDMGIDPASLDQAGVG